MSTYYNPQIHRISLVGTDAKPGMFSKPGFAGSVDKMGGGGGHHHLPGC